MKSPRSPQELSRAIDELVAAYLDEARRLALGALEQAFARSGGRARATKRRSGARPATTRSPAPSRRTAAEIGEVQERLFAMVCARPGEGMAVLAEEVGLPLRNLQRPMSRLRAEGRVRCVGERGLARYFPAAGRRLKNAEG